jgi:hypothetical protein
MRELKKFGLLSRMTSTICFSVLVFLPKLSVGQSHCLEYEPTKVELTGKLVQKTYPGPPGYESISNGDRSETSWYLSLADPICVSADKDQPELNPDQKDIRLIQLVIQPAVYQQKKKLIGKRVIVSGSLFGAHTGHHHTAVLLTVSVIESAH